MEPLRVLQPQQGEHALVPQVAAKVVLFSQTVKRAILVAYELVESSVNPHGFQIVQDHPCVEALVPRIVRRGIQVFGGLLKEKSVARKSRLFLPFQ